MSKSLTDVEKEMVAALYQTALQRQKSLHPTLSEDEFAQFLVKESATWAEYEYVTNFLTKNRTEWIQGRIFVQPTSQIHEVITGKIEAAIGDAIREQSQELKRILVPGRAPSISWGDGGSRQPDGSFTIKVNGVRRQYCLILEVNFRSLTTTKFIEKLEGWITETTDVMVVIGLDLKPNQQRQLFAIHVYQYFRSVDGQKAVSKYMNDADRPTFQCHPPNAAITIDLKGMFWRCPELFDSLFEAGYIQSELVVSVPDLLSLAFSEYQDFLFLRET